MPTDYPSSRTGSMPHPHRFGRTLLASFFCLVVPTSAVRAAEGDTIHLRELMTPEQLQATGVHRLSDEERRALERWLEAYTRGTETPAAKTEVPPSGAEPPVAVVPAAPPKAAPAAPPKVAPTAPPRSAPAEQPETKAPAATKAAAPAVDENFGFPEPVRDSDTPGNELHAQVVEPFRGWSGKTVFRLDNGQVWRQRIAGRYTYTGDDNRVVIRKNSWGFYEMTLVAEDRTVGVARVR